MFGTYCRRRRWMMAPLARSFRGKCEAKRDASIRVEIRGSNGSERDGELQNGGRGACADGKLDAVRLGGGEDRGGNVGGPGEWDGGGRLGWLGRGNVGMEWIEVER